MSARPFDLRMNDGSRHFGDLPESRDSTPPEWERLRDGVGFLPGARLTGFVTDQVTEAWIDFEHRGHAFSINDQHGQWWFFVRDPGCPDGILEGVLDHFERVLGPRAALVMAAGAMAEGSFRVLVHEADGRVGTKDFAELDAAKRYADDAASETEDGVVSAHVFDAELRTVWEGRHY